MNKIMKAITALCNAQRDRHFRTPEDRKKIRKPEDGFNAVLKGEEKKLKKGGNHNAIMQNRPK